MYEYPDFVILREGVAHLRDTKVKVSQVVTMQQKGADVSDILDAYPDLTENDLRTAVIYHKTHEEEVEAEITDKALKKAS